MCFWFERIIPVEIEERNEVLEFFCRLTTTAYSKSKNYDLIILEISKADDFFVFYKDEISKYDFEFMKEAQNLTLNFDDLAQALKDKLELCLEDPETNSCSLNLESLILSFQTNFDFKIIRVVELSLR